MSTKNFSDTKFLVLFFWIWKISLTPNLLHNFSDFEKFLHQISCISFPTFKKFLRHQISCIVFPTLKNLSDSKFLVLLFQLRKIVLESWCRKNFLKFQQLKKKFGVGKIFRIYKNYIINFASNIFFKFGKIIQEVWCGRKFSEGKRIQEIRCRRNIFVSKK